jgi:hypothetical protein
MIRRAGVTRRDSDSPMFEENRTGMPLAERLRLTTIDEVIGQTHPQIFGLPQSSVGAKHA